MTNAVQPPHNDRETGACDGLLVIDLSEGMSGSLATMVLADHGATVIKVEPPGGDWARELPGFAMWNRGKQSLVVDWDRPQDRAQVTRLLASADVLVDTMTDEQAQARGLTRSVLDELNPRLVQCSISAVGPAEALAGRVPAYDGIVSALVGRMSETDLLNGAIPDQDRAWPVFTTTPTPSYGAAQLALQGVLAALLNRVGTGRGDRVQTSLVEGWIAFMMRHELSREQPDDAALPSDLFMRALHLCFMTAECGDGRYIQMCARQERHFRAWLQAIGLWQVAMDPEYAHAPFGLSAEQLDDLEVMLRAGMRKHTQREWIQAFTEDFDVGGDPFLDPSEFLSHPQMTENDRIVTLDDPERGPTRQVGPLVSMSQTPALIVRAAPRLGEHADLSALASALRVPADAPSAGEVLPLAGVTIIETAYFVAGPLATSLLAELGARIIKLEPLDGDPYRRAGLQAVKFLHGKESLALDLKSRAGTEILDRLVRGADVFVHSFRPGVPERLRLDYPRLRSLNDRLIYLNASSYGSRGPQSHRVAFHSTPTALTGAGRQQAGHGNPPVDDSFPDPGSGLAAASALMLGLWARETTGHGQYLETTMLTSSGYVVSNDLTQYAGMPAWRLNDRGQHGLDPLYRLYRCRDGWLFLAAVQPAHRSSLAAALGEAGRVGDLVGQRSATDDKADERLTTALSAAFGTDDATTWVDRLTAHRVPSVVVTADKAPDWLERTGLLSPAEHDGFGRYWRLPPKLRFDNARVAIDRPPATIGEHTHALLAELAFTADEIVAMTADGVIAGSGLT